MVVVGGGGEGGGGVGNGGCGQLLVVGMMAVGGVNSPKFHEIALLYKTLF